MLASQHLTDASKLVLPVLTALLHVLAALHCDSSYLQTEAVKEQSFQDDMASSCAKDCWWILRPCKTRTIMLVIVPARIHTRTPVSVSALIKTAATQSD